MSQHMSCCSVDWCDEPKNKEMGDKLCTRHTLEWRRSREFRAAASDEKVILWVRLRCDKEANRAISKYRRMWVKRLEEGEVAS